MITMWRLCDAESVVFKGAALDGKPVNFFPDTAGNIHGGKPDLVPAPDDTFWVGRWWGYVQHFDRHSFGQRVLDTCGAWSRITFCTPALHVVG